MRKKIWYIFILMLLRPMTIKATNSDSEKAEGIIINEKLIEIINEKLLFINYPENIYLLYEINVCVNNLQIKVTEKELELFNSMCCFKKIDSILYSRHEKLVDNEQYTQYDIIKCFLNEFSTYSSSNLRNITFFNINSCKNNISVTKYLAEQTKILKEYDHTNDNVVLQMYFLMVDLIKKLEIKFQNHKKWQEIYKCWIEPFCDAFKLEISINKDYPQFQDLIIFIHEYLKIIHKIFKMETEMLFKVIFQNFERKEKAF